MRTTAARSKQVVVHIGTHKTGSTSLQVFLGRNRDSLREKGVYVPHSGTLASETGHHNIAWQLRRDARFRPEHGTVDDLLAELSQVGCRRAILSSEDFEYLVQKPEILRDFEKKLMDAGFETAYLVFFRNQVDYANSLYSELVKHDLAVPFIEFVQQVYRNGLFMTHGDWCYHFDFETFAQGWQRCVHGHLKSYSFDTAANDAGVIPTVLRDLGLNDDAVMRRAKAAPKFNVKGGEIMVLARYILNKTAAEERVSERQKELAVHILGQMPIRIRRRFNGFTKFGKMLFRERFRNKNQSLYRMAGIKVGKEEKRQFLASSAVGVLQPVAGAVLRYRPSRESRREAGELARKALNRACRAV